MTDEALMLAVRSGDLAKLGILFERHHVALFDFLARLTGDRAAAEDLVQDIFVRVLRYRATFRDEGRFETWLYRIARNARADHFRHRRVSEPLDQAALDWPERAPGPALRLEVERDRARLYRALMMLREDKRELIVLARYQDLRYEQIAEILGIEVGAVKVRVHRAIRDLRDIFLQLKDEHRSCNVTTPRPTLQII